MVGFSLEAGLVGVSILISSLVLLGQRRVAIRESIEQLDDRQLGSNTLKIKPILHNVRFRPSISPTIELLPPWKTTFAIRFGYKGDYAGLSTPGNITRTSPELRKEVLYVDGVYDAELVTHREVSDGIGMDTDDSMEEVHTELLFSVRSINPVFCRNVTDRVMARIRAVDRL